MNDDELVKAFEKCTVDEWTHRMHVRVAYVYLRRYRLNEAIIRMRAGLKASVAAAGIEETDNFGYSETVTVAWMSLIDAMMREHGAPKTSERFLKQHSHLANPRLLRLFYSRDIWVECDCTSRFVAPDLAALPMPRSVY